MINMEDIKVYFHGRPQGQNVWGVGDGDIAGVYLEQILNWTYGKDLPACMIIEHWNGDTYYSYIHRKDVLEKNGIRQDAYCAITLRIDHNECHNVATLYELLKTAYKQLVGKAIQVDNKGFERFLITKFSDIKEYLSEISKSVIENIESHDKLKNSIFPLDGEKNTKDDVVSYALQEVDSPAFREDAKQNRILVSEYIKPKTNFLKGQVDKLKTEKESLQAQLTSVSDEIAARFDNLLKGKEDEINKLKQDLECVLRDKNDDDVRKQDFYSNIKNDINQIIETARQLASRFPDSCQENLPGSNPSKREGSSFAISEVWYRRVTLVLLALLFVCSVALLVKINNGGGHEQKTDNPTEQSDASQKTDSALTIHIEPSPVDYNLIVDTKYTLLLSKEDLECKWYYEDSLGVHQLDDVVLCPKTPNSHIIIKAVVDGKTVATSEFNTINSISQKLESSPQNRNTVRRTSTERTKATKSTTAKGNSAAKTSGKGMATKSTDAAKTSSKETAEKGADEAKAH